MLGLGPKLLLTARLKAIEGQGHRKVQRGVSQLTPAFLFPNRIVAWFGMMSSSRQRQGRIYELWYVERWLEQAAAERLT